mgnify:FL=1
MQQHPCHFSRSEEIAQILKEELGVGIGETTEDGVFAYHYIPVWEPAT